MRTVGISLLGAALALIISAVTGCTLRQSGAQHQSGQAASNPSPQPVEGLCKSPDAPPSDVAHKPGYRQFDVSVTNSMGWPVSGLTQQDFLLYAGSRTFPVAYFREHNNGEPVAIALLVDTSASMMSKLPIVQQSLGDFVKNLNQCDEVILFAFNSQVYLIQPFSTDHQIAAERIMELFHPYGRSALYDATSTALQSLERADYPSLKLVLITDGMDNSSATTEQEVVARATMDGIPIYTVGIGDPNAPEKSHVTGHRAADIPQPIAPDKFLPAAPPVVTFWSGTDRVEPKSLEDLSAMAGGRSFIVPSRGEDRGESFETAIFTIADNIAKGYAIGAVIPQNVSPSTVKATVVKRLNLDVRTRPITAAP